MNKDNLLNLIRKSINESRDYIGNIMIITPKMDVTFKTVIVSPEKERFEKEIIIDYITFANMDKKCCNFGLTIYEKNGDKNVVPMFISESTIEEFINFIFVNDIEFFITYNKNYIDHVLKKNRKTN